MSAPVDAYSTGRDLPTMTDDPSSRTVFVVSLGTGSRRTAKWLYELANQYDVDPEFRFVSIESTDIDGGDVPDEFRNIPLDTDSRVKRRFERAKTDPAVPYLDENHTLPSEGTSRVPNVGRFLLEHHSRRVHEMLSEEIGTAVGPTDSELSVWVLASLSGGTAPGMFPLVSAMAGQIATDIGARYNIDVYLNGLGTVSELRAANQRVAPSGISEYFVNTNNSLHALSTLLNLPDAHGRPQINGPTRLEMPAAPDVESADGLLDPSFEIAEPPLAAMLLMPIDEDRAEDGSWDGDERTSYLAGVNYKLAAAVLALSTTSGDNDLGNLYSTVLDDRLYTIDAASVRASVEPALELLNTEQQIDAVESEISELEACVDDLESLADQLSSLRSTDVDAGSVPDLVGALSAPLAGRTSQLVESVSAIDLTEASFEEIEIQIERVFAEVPTRAVGDSPFPDEIHESELGDFAADQFVPHRTVGRYVFLKMVRARLLAEIEAHPFSDRVEDLWEKNAQELEEEFAGLSDADVATQYEQAIDPFLATHEQDLENQLSNTSMFSFRERSRLQRQLESVRETRQELKQLFDEYEHLGELRERIASGELPPLGSELQTTIDLVEKGSERGTQLLTSKRNHLESLQQTRETFRNRVTDTTSGRITEIPLDIKSTDSLSRETLVNASTLFDLVESGLLTRDGILREIDRAMGLIREPLEDNFHEMADNHPNRLLIPMANPGNDPVLTMTGTTQPSMGSIMANNDVTTQLDTGTIADPFRIDYVMLHGNVRLANTSEYRVLRERWEAGDIQRLLGEEVDLVQNLAYPELVPMLSAPADRHDDDGIEADDSDEGVTL